MEKNNNWSDLLTLSGYSFRENSDNQFSILNETKQNRIFLRKLLSENKVQYRIICVRKDGLEHERFSDLDLEFIESEFYQDVYIKLLSNPPERDAWVNSLCSVGGRCSGLSCKSDNIELEILDVPLLPAVRQLNRLGLNTKYSCIGHGKRKPWIQFVDQESTKKALQVVRQMGYFSSISGSCTLSIRESEKRIVKLGMDLSLLNSLSVEDLKFHQKTRRECLLEELLMIPGETYHEDEIRAYVNKQIHDITDKATIDSHGNLLAIKKTGIGPTILLSAHLDLYEEIDCGNLIIKNGQIWRRSQGILGADDRAGVALIISILQNIGSTDFKGTIKVVFTVEEERGQTGAVAIDPIFFWGIDCAISLDRKGGSDIVNQNKVSGQQYGSKEYGAVFEQISRELWNGQNDYSVTGGGTSDLRVWSALGVESVNLSIGYHDEHHEGEYLNLDEWHRTYDLVMAALLALRYWVGRRGNNGISRLHR